MSLDVSLTVNYVECKTDDPTIFIREGGRVVQISREEWNKRFPEREPVMVRTDPHEVFSANITHNLNKMAAEAGIYKHLWRPEEIGITKARELIEPLRAGLELLRNNPRRFKKFNPPNRWGNYDGLVEFVSEYLAACERWPDADVSVSR